MGLSHAPSTVENSRIVVARVNQARTLLLLNLWSQIDWSRPEMTEAQFNSSTWHRARRYKVRKNLRTEPAKRGTVKIFMGRVVQIVGGTGETANEGGYVSVKENVLREVSLDVLLRVGDDYAVQGAKARQCTSKLKKSYCVRAAVEADSVLSGNRMDPGEWTVEEGRGAWWLHGVRRDEMMASASCKPQCYSSRDSRQRNDKSRPSRSWSLRFCHLVRIQTLT
ncbi:hypothetical protein C8R47DRAFT_1197894 [Mycena vitilis]|nr:hypothetical protein C8R47DRAFT_1197894 [Mycena vitilis]